MSVETTLHNDLQEKTDTRNIVQLLQMSRTVACTEYNYTRGFWLCAQLLNILAGFHTNTQRHAADEFFL